MAGNYLQIENVLFTVTMLLYVAAMVVYFLFHIF